MPRCIPGHCQYALDVGMVAACHPRGHCEYELAQEAQRIKQLVEETSQPISPDDIESFRKLMQAREADDVEIVLCRECAAPARIGHFRTCSRFTPARKATCPDCGHELQHHLGMFKKCPADLPPKP